MDVLGGNARGDEGIGAELADASAALHAPEGVGGGHEDGPDADEGRQKHGCSAKRGCALFWDQKCVSWFGTEESIVVETRAESKRQQRETRTGKCDVRKI